MESPLLQAVLTYSTDLITAAVSLYDSSTTELLEVNKAWLKLYSYDEKEDIQLFLSDILAAHHQQGYFQKFLWEHSESALEWHKKKDGTIFPVEVSHRSFNWQGRPLILVIAHDQSERLRSEESALKHTSEIVRHQKTLLALAQLDRTNWQHELQTLLAQDAHTLQIERVSYWRMDKTQQTLTCESLYCLSEQQHQQPLLKRQTRDFPVYFRALLDKQTIITGNAQTDPRTAAFQNPYLQPLGITGMLDVPICYQGELEGVLCHEHVGPPREWTHDEVDFAVAIGTLVTLALEADYRHQAEERLRAALEKEKELNELKSGFISMVSHEFRTPLTTMMSNTELLLHYSQNWDDEKRQKIYQRLQDSLRWLSGLLDEVLVFGKAEAGKLDNQPKPLDVVACCRDILELISVGPGHRHRLVFESKCPEPYQLLDEKLLQHIVSNLLSNAVKYSEPDSDIRFTLQQTATDMILQVQDQGIGIPEEALPHLFTPFYRAPNVSHIHGTGLGTAIVMQCVEKMGGTILVNSAPNQGTCIEVRLPIMTMDKKIDNGNTDMT